MGALGTGQVITSRANNSNDRNTVSPEASGSQAPAIRAAGEACFTTVETMTGTAERYTTIETMIGESAGLGGSMERGRLDILGGSDKTGASRADKKKGAGGRSPSR